MGEEAEKDRIAATKSVLARYGEIEADVSKSRSEETNALSLFFECIKSDVDLGTYASEFTLSWPEPAKTCYENYKIKQNIPSMSLIRFFNVYRFDIWSLFT